LLVMLVARGVELNDVRAELAQRRKPDGGASAAE
jgi:phosphoribosyl-ATP pyrophosphohydrolase